jgi:hypothetical protein
MSDGKLRYSALQNRLHLLHTQKIHSHPCRTSLANRESDAQVVKGWLFCRVQAQAWQGSFIAIKVRFHLTDLVVSATSQAAAPISACSASHSPKAAEDDKV